LNEAMEKERICGKTRAYSYCHGTGGTKSSSRGWMAVSKLFQTNQYYEKLGEKTK
jgi:hypothetical protein